MVAKTASNDARKVLPIAATSTPAVPVGKHYYPVKLVAPPGASAGPKLFVELAEIAIQNAVDLLGRGTTQPPPAVDALLKPSFYKNLGAGATAEKYKEAVDKVEAKQTSLQEMDKKVLETSGVVADEQNRALRFIIGIVEDVQRKLKAFGTAKLKPHEDTAVMDLLASAIEVVYHKVTIVAKNNDDLANGGGKDGGGKNDGGKDKSGGDKSGGGSSGGGNAGGGNAGGGGGDGLSSIMQSLPMLAAMLPAMAMPLVQQLPELLKHDDAADKEHDDEKADDKKAHAGATPAPADPNAPPAGATAPDQGQPAPPANNNAEPDRPESDKPESNTPEAQG
ncbi:hypothetical protein [Nocardia australiensis]|uniref:hypothetical protein n=1 Tax=Nocardia australiensis TaxID=2887191 RepID=UPI001D15068B|nr:hypothetical protein [Nocardia australiensis]